MQGRLTGLDALRGIAAILVLGFHLHTVFGASALFSRAYLAVDFFFMLSGFVMARTYEARFPELTPLRFFVIRFKRLWGVMAVGTALGFTVFAIAGSYYPGLAILGLLFIPALWRFQPYELNRAEWSIFFELLANIVHALVLWRLSTRALLAVAGTALFVTVLYDGGTFLAGNVSPNFGGGIARVLLAYSIGIVIHREGWRIDAPIWTAALLLPAAMLLARLGPFDFVFVILVCPIALMIGLNREARWGRFIGDMSFPLYAVHYPILQGAKHLDLGPWLGGTLAVVVAVMLVAFFALTKEQQRKRGRAKAMAMG